VPVFDGDRLISDRREAERAQVALRCDRDSTCTTVRCLNISRLRPSARGEFDISASDQQEKNRDGVPHRIQTLE
jgi:hypothetical protein